MKAAGKEQGGTTRPGGGGQSTVCVLNGGEKPPAGRAAFRGRPPVQVQRGLVERVDGLILAFTQMDMSQQFGGYASDQGVATQDQQNGRAVDSGAAGGGGRHRCVPSSASFLARPSLVKLQATALLLTVAMTETETEAV